MSRFDPSRIRLVLFDLDGTLVDTAPDMVGAANELRAEQGLAPAPYGQVRDHVSRGGAGVIRAAWGGAEDAPVDELLGRFLDLYARRITRRSRLFEGMAAVLDRIEARGWRWGVVTNKNTRLSEALLTGLGLRCRLATLICGDTLATRKPDPAGIVQACAEAGAAVAQCVYVGDDRRDIQAGQAAGCSTIAAAYGYIPADEDHVDWRADRTIFAAGQLTTLLGLGGAETPL